MLVKAHIFAIQWQLDNGCWITSPNATFDDWVDAEVEMDWLIENCPLLVDQHPHRIAVIREDGREFLFKSY